MAVGAVKVRRWTSSVGHCQFFPSALLVQIVCKCRGGTELVNTIALLFPIPAMY